MGRFLIVDDNRMMRGFLERLVQKIPGVDVIQQAENGKVALEKIAIFKPDVVLSDVEMPVMDGIQMLQQIKKNKAAKMYDFNFNVIMLSGTMYNNDANVRRAKFLGAFEVLAKPEGKSMSFSLDMSKLEKAVTAALKNKR